MYQVLIVDDEPIVKIALQSMLNWEDLGFCICALASNGKEALDMAERFHPDLIICDLKMPVLDGLALIRTAKETGMDCEFLVISNYEDFNTVRTALVLGAFDYLLKVSISPEALTEQLKKIRLKLDAKHAVPAYTERQYLNRVSNEQKHAAWRDFFIHPTHSADCSIQNSQLPFDSSEAEQSNTISLCQISFDNCRDSVTLPDTDLICSTLKNALEQIERRVIIFLDDSNVLLVLPDQELSLHKTTLSSLCARISQLFGYYMSLAPSILYQSRLASLEESRKVYGTFQPLFGLNFYEPLGVADASSLTQTAPALSYKELASRILDYTGENRMSFAFQKITEFLDRCRKDHVPPANAIQSCIRLLGSLEYQIPGGTSPVHEQLADLADSMRKARHAEELAGFVASALPLIFSPNTKEISKPPLSIEISQAVSFIEDHYDSKISLTDIADYVGLSSSYLCRVFKEETGVNINTYINNLRMAKAVRLLEDKNYYIKEVAISVGFDDQLYFSRLFKKYYGVTPSQYRAAVK